MDGVRLIHGDCLDVLRTLEAGSIDAVVTDPPYGIGFNYSGKKEVASNPDVYWRWLEPIYQECLRSLKPGGFFCFWQAHKNFRHLWNWFGNGIQIYAACKNFVQLMPSPININGFDPVAVGYKPGAKPLKPSKQKRSVNFFVANTAGVISDVSRIEKQHPCPRPLDQTVTFVDNFVADGATVLDPFMGSGTTGVACVQTGRKFIGIEIDENYFKIAEKRIAEAANATPLFANSQ